MTVTYSVFERECCFQAHGAAGVMDLLVSGDVDMILYPMPLSIARIEAVDITSSVLDGGITLLVHKGDYNPPIFGFLRPFSWQVQAQGLHLHAPHPSEGNQVKVLQLHAVA